jgi:hypothetical protein
MLGHLNATRIKNFGESKAYEREVCHFCAGKPSGEKMTLELTESLAAKFRERQGLVTTKDIATSVCHSDAE